MHGVSAQVCAREQANGQANSCVASILAPCVVDLPSSTPSRLVRIPTAPQIAEVKALKDCGVAPAAVFEHVQNEGPRLPGGDQEEHWSSSTGSMAPTETSHSPSDGAIMAILVVAVILFVLLKLMHTIGGQGGRLVRRGFWTPSGSSSRYVTASSKCSLPLIRSTFHSIRFTHPDASLLAM